MLPERGPVWFPRCEPISRELLEHQRTATYIQENGHVELRRRLRADLIQPTSTILAEFLGRFMIRSTASCIAIPNTFS